MLLLCFIIAVIVGTVFANVFRPFYADQYYLFNPDYIKTLKEIDINGFQVFQMALIKHLKEFLLLWVLCITILGTPYIIIKSCTKGFCVGFIIATATMGYGFKGILLFLVYLFPHYLILIPLYVITFTKGAQMCSKINQKTEVVAGSRRGIIMRYVPIFFIVLCLIVIASLLEGYVNSGIFARFMILLQ